MDNSTNSSGRVPVCMTESFNQAKENAEYFTYTLLVFPYFILGVIGHILFLSASLRQAKQEGAYLYQIFLAATKICEITSFTILSLAFNRWAGLGNEGAGWYRNSYGLMWFAAHANIPLVNGFINSCLLLALCMSVDRALALGAPHTYRNVISKRKVRIICFAVCLLIGFLIVGFDTMRFLLRFDPAVGLYFLETNTAYMKSVTATVLANIRNGILVVSVLSLTVCNLMVIVMYRKKMVGGGNQEQGNGVVSEAKSKQRRKAEKTLTLLTICQSTLNTIGVGFLATFFILIYLAPAFVNCEGLLMSPILDATLQIVSLLDFYAPVLVSKTFRRMVFPWCRSSEVSTAGQSRTQGTEVKRAW